MRCLRCLSALYIPPVAEPAPLFAPSRSFRRRLAAVLMSLGERLAQGQELTSCAASSTPGTTIGRSPS